MNRIPFTDRPDFPLDSETLNNLQNLSSVELQNTVVGLIDRNAIITGVNSQNDSYTDGIVILNNEILQFRASAGEYFVIREETTSVQTETGDYTVLYIRWTEATNEITPYPITVIPRINMSQKLGVAQRADGYTYLTVDSDFIQLNTRLMTVYNQAGFCTIRGRITIKAFTTQPNNWITLVNLNDITIPIAQLLIPYQPLVDTSVIFPGFSESQPNTQIQFRITNAGELQVFAQGNASPVGNWYVNTVYYNPQNA